MNINTRRNNRGQTPGKKHMGGIIYKRIRQKKKNKQKKQGWDINKNMEMKEKQGRTTKREDRG